jgi:hypothetical protein
MSESMPVCLLSVPHTAAGVQWDGEELCNLKPFGSGAKSCKTESNVK